MHDVTVRIPLEIHKTLTEPASYRTLREDLVLALHILERIRASSKDGDANDLGYSVACRQNICILKEQGFITPTLAPVHHKERCILSERGHCVACGVFPLASGSKGRSPCPVLFMNTVQCHLFVAHLVLDDVAIHLTQSEYMLHRAEGASQCMTVRPRRVATRHCRAMAKESSTRKRQVNKHK
jgi:hypothetical protein